MPSPLDKKVNDLGLIYVPPLSETDPRVPLPEEFTLDSSIRVDALRRSRLERGWMALPEISILPPRTVAISAGQLVSPIYPGILSLTTQVGLPPLTSPNSLVREDQILHLVCFSAEVGAAQEAILGQVSFQYKDRTSQQILTIEKENARRLRAFWVLVLSTNVVTPETFLSSLTLESNGERRLRVVNNTDEGFELNNAVFYAKDSNLVVGSTYSVFLDSVEISEVCRIRRLQNYSERGFVWGLNGETPLSPQFNVLKTQSASRPATLETQLRKRFFQIISGQPDLGATYLRSVQNLTSGAVGGNPGRPGESAGSPNNSVCLANDQRVTFTNQLWTQKTAVQIVTAGNDGNGNAQVIATLNSNVPLGTVFSESRSDHKIYTTNGVEESGLGNFTNLGGSGTLVWVGDSNSSIRPGSVVYVVPGVSFPAGSGSSIPFEQVEQAWLNAVAISSGNIRVGDSFDLMGYEDPVNAENFILVTGRERAACIHYIYRRITVTSDANGTLLIPNAQRGCFAFIDGVAGRIDAPVYRGLTPSTPYKALVYYPPRSTENWQFLLRYCQYQGLGDADFLNGATIASRPLYAIHTQGGGNSVFQGDAAIRYVPISMHLPEKEDFLGSYEFNAPIQLVGEPYSGPSTYREIPLISGAGLALPAPGQTLSFEANGNTETRSLNGRLLADGRTLGFRTPVLASRTAFQSTVAFVAQKGSQFRLVVITNNGLGGENVVADSAQNAAIDVFNI